MTELFLRPSPLSEARREPEGVVEQLHAVPARAARRPRGRATLSTLAADSLLLAAAVLVTRLGSSARFDSRATAWSVAVGLVTVLLLFQRGMYGNRLRLSGLDDLRVVVIATAVATMLVLSTLLLISNDAASARDQVRLFAYATVYVGTGRLLADWLANRRRREANGGRPTLIVGAGRVGRTIARHLVEQPELGLAPIGFLDADPLEQGALPDGLEVLGASWDLEQVIAERGIEHVIVSFSTAPNDVLLRILRQCEELGVEVSLVPRLFDRMTSRLSVEYVGGMPLLFAHRPDPKGWHFTIKHALDRVLAAIALLLSAPILGLAALAIRLTMGGPVLFRQRRIGRDGRSFEMLKLRSMEAAGPSGSARVLLPLDTAPGGVEGGVRMTRLGAVLRRTGIDELPQLVNVLKGEMSIVGPRPERPEFVEVFERGVRRYGERHRVKSGITGWAQVYGLRGRTSISDRVEWDNYYIENWSLWLDLKILLMTVAAVIHWCRLTRRSGTRLGEGLGDAT